MVNGICECAAPNFLVQALNGTVLRECLATNTQLCPAGFPITVRDLAGAITACLSSNTACPSGSLPQIGLSGSPVECRVGGTACQFIIGSTPFSIPVTASPSNTLVGCLSNGATACPSSHRVAFAEQPSWSIQRCTNQTSCPTYVTAENTRFFVPGFSSSNQLVACLTTDYTSSGNGRIGACPQIQGLNFSIAAVDLNPATPLVADDQWTVACLQMGAACPLAQPIRFYGVSDANQQQVYCQPVPPGGACPSTAYNVPPFNAFSAGQSTLGPYSVEVVAGGALRGCVWQNPSACPPDYPQPTYDAGLNIIGCGPGGSSVVCPSGTIPAKNALGVTERCLAAIAVGNECPSNTSPGGNNYPISVRTSNGAILECLALGSACPAAHPFPQYAVGFSSVPANALPVVRQCWASRSDCTFSTNPGPVNYNVEVFFNDTTLAGCVAAGATDCPASYTLAYRDAATALVECRPSTQTSCPVAGYSLPARDNGVLVACLPNGLAACPQLLYPRPVSTSSTGPPTACLTAASPCPVNTLFLASGAAPPTIQRCLTVGTLPANCAAITNFNGAEAFDAGGVNLAGCYATGATVCLPGQTPFYELVAGPAWELNQCRTALPSGDCPSAFPVRGLDANLAIAACIDNDSGSGPQGCPTSTAYSVAVAATPSTLNAAVEACLNSAVTQCPATVLSQPRAFEIYNGNNLAGTAGQLVGCVASTTASCSGSFVAEVYSDAAGTVLEGCVAASSTSCPLSAPFPTLANANTLEDCRPSLSACPAGAVSLRLAAASLNGCMSSNTAACPGSAQTGGVSYSLPMLGATAVLNPVAVLKDCRVSPSPAPTGCSSFGSYSVPVRDGTPASSTFRGCLEQGASCPTSGAYARPIFALDNTGSLITACYQTSPGSLTTSGACPAGMEVEVLGTNGDQIIGCMASSGTTASCTAIATASGYPVPGTSSTFKFLATGSALTHCTSQALSGATPCNTVSTFIKEYTAAISPDSSVILVGCGTACGATLANPPFSSVSCDNA